MNYKNLKRIEKIKSLLEGIAFFSLFLDIGIALTTLLSFKYNVDLIQAFFNYALTAEVIISAILFILLILIRHYEKIIDSLVYMFFSKKKKKNKRLKY